MKSLKKMIVSRKVLASFTVGAYIAMVGSAQAGWVDSWMSQNVETPSGTFTSQQRGYMTGGGFGARWETGSESPISIQKPSTKSGCGGIDVFWGGMSFLNPDFLIKKLQNMIQNAPAVAFDMALKALSDQLSTSIKGFNDITDKLNSLQFDDCNASKKMVAMLADGTSAAMKAKDLTEGGTAFWQKSGMSDMWKDGKDALGKMGSDVEDIGKGINQAITGTTPAKATDDVNLQGCPAEIQQFLPSSGSSSTMLGVYGAKMGLDPSFMALMRGLLGDFQVTYTPGKLDVLPIVECPQNPSYEKFLGGEVQGKYEKMDGGTLTVGPCVPENGNDPNKGIVSQITTRLNSIVTNMKQGPNGQGLTQDDINFIQMSPLPVYSALKIGIITQQEQLLLKQLAGITARAYAQRMLTDLYARARSIVNLANQSLKKNGDTSGTDAKPCLFPVGPELIEHAKNMLEKIDKFNQMATAEYMTSMQDYSRTLQFVQQLDSINREAQRQIANNLGPSVARRITQKR